MQVSNNFRAQISTDTRAVNRPSSEITNVSLDFNAAPNGQRARGTEVIIPDNATPQQRRAAELYNAKVVEFARRHGIANYPNRGVKTRSENGRGVSNTIHTEGFFNSDIQMQRLVQANPDEFAEIVASTFGELEDVRILPPHGVGNDRGATSSVFGNETQFGRMIVDSINNNPRGSKNATGTQTVPLTDNQREVFGQAQPLATADTFVTRGDEPTNNSVGNLGVQEATQLYDPNSEAGRYEALLDNENIQRTLQTIRFAEGTTTHGERTAFGGSRISGDLADHPRVSRQFRDRSGKLNRTTAAGAYQFLQGTWDEVSGRLGLNDFSKRNQEIAALRLLDETGSLEPALEGNIERVAQLAGGKWASLGFNNYNQPTKRLGELRQAFDEPVQSTSSTSSSQSNEVGSSATPSNATRLTPEQVGNILNAPTLRSPNLQTEPQSQPSVAGQNPNLQGQDQPAPPASSALSTNTPVLTPPTNQGNVGSQDIFINTPTVAGQNPNTPRNGQTNPTTSPIEPVSNPNVSQTGSLGQPNRTNLLGDVVTGPTNPEPPNQFPAAGTTDRTGTQATETTNNPSRNGTRQARNPAVSQERNEALRRAVQTRRVRRQGNTRGPDSQRSLGFGTFGALQSQPFQQFQTVGASLIAPIGETQTTNFSNFGVTSAPTRGFAGFGFGQ